MSKVLIKPPETNVQEAQSLAQAQEMLLSVFSSIAYIRDLFAEDSYEQAKLAGMQTKRLKRNSSPQADQLLSWIEKGCFDALQKKYLESVILGIFEDPTKPHVMLETYTLTIDYPSSKDHQQIREARGTQVNMRLTMKKDGSESVLASGNAFQKETVALLRNLCVMTQTLGPLPEKRFLTMQLTYYDELTPRDYEPPGFTPTDFDVNSIFEKPTMKHDFGEAKSGHHSIGLKMETVCTEPKPGDAKNEAMVPTTQAPIQLQTVHDNHDAESPEEPNLVKNLSKVNLDGDKSAAVVSGTQIVRCSCGDVETDLDMIQCDFCGHWQHTPCVGFCSNRDKRIPKDNYKCYNCRFGHSKKIMAYLQELSCVRRVIAILYTDGVKSITDLAERLACPIKKASKILTRVEAEGLVKREINGPRHAFITCSGQSVKEKLNQFFGPDPERLPDFPGSNNPKRKPDQGIPTDQTFEVRPKLTALKRRKSQTAAKIDA